MRENIMSIRKSKVFAVAAAACVLGMMLGGCGSSTSGNATEGSNVITALTPNRRMA